MASYLIVTLGATALAKVKNWRIASVGIQRERVIPAGAASAVIIALAIAEFSLATLLMLGAAPVATGFATAALFVVFAGYRLMVAVKTKSLMCSCAGMLRADPASLPSVAGASLACLILAAFASVLVFLGPPAGYPVGLLAVAAWAVPLAIFAAGTRRGRRGSGTGNVLPAELLHLWTAEMNAKR